MIVGSKFKLMWSNEACMCATVLPAKSDSDFMLCLQSYQGLIVDRTLVY